MWRILICRCYGSFPFCWSTLAFVRALWLEGTGTLKPNVKPRPGDRELPRVPDEMWRTAKVPAQALLFRHLFPSTAVWLFCCPVVRSRF